MKWFKHMTHMSQDVRVKRLIRKYGIEGYGLYNYILELIVRRLDTDSPMPDLEESSNDIAGDMSMDTLKVEEIMWFCIEQGLLSQDEMSGRLVAHKVYKFLQQSETRSEEIRNMISAYKKSDNEGEKLRLGLSETNVKNRREENRREEKRVPPKSKDEYKGKPVNQSILNTLLSDYGAATVDSYFDKIISWESAKGKSGYKDYASACRNWLLRDNVPRAPRDLNGTDEEVEAYRRLAAKQRGEA